MSAKTYEIVEACAVFAWLAAPFVLLVWDYLKGGAK